MGLAKDGTWMLYSICQRYNFESNLQQEDAQAFNAQSCIRYVKDTILKAIYNRLRENVVVTGCCIRYVKDTILKAIYNFFQELERGVKLYSICQRYNFESNLQRRC